MRLQARHNIVFYIMYCPITSVADMSHHRIQKNTAGDGITASAYAAVATHSGAQANAQPKLNSTDISAVNLEIKNVLAEVLRYGNSPNKANVDNMSSFLISKRVRKLWYEVFKHRPLSDKQRRSHDAIMDIFNIYGRHGNINAVSVIRSVLAMYNQDFYSEQFCEYNESYVHSINHYIKSMLQKVEPEPQLIVPIMFDGILPASFVHGLLTRLGIPTEVAFIGYSRYDNYAACTCNYESRTVYVPPQSAEKLRRHVNSKVLVVDDIIETGETSMAVMAKLYSEFGISNPKTLFMKDMRSRDPA